jgi:hypothetical protein
MIGLLLVVQVSDASDQRCMTLFLCPLNCFSLGFESRKGMVRVIFDDVIIDVAAVWSPFRSCFDVNIRHRFLPVSAPADGMTRTLR